jgi:hypothetical protein
MTLVYYLKLRQDGFRSYLIFVLSWKQNPKLIEETRGFELLTSELWVVGLVPELPIKVLKLEQS